MTYRNERTRVPTIGWNQCIFDVWHSKEQHGQLHQDGHLVCKMYLTSAMLYTLLIHGKYTLQVHVDGCKSCSGSRYFAEGNYGSDITFFVLALHYRIKYIYIYIYLLSLRESSCHCIHTDHVPFALLAWSLQQATGSMFLGWLLFCRHLDWFE